MSGMLLGSIDLSTMASRGAKFAETVSVGAFRRLAQLAIDGELRINLAVEKGTFGHILVSGDAQGELAVQCQRCLERMIVPVAVDMQLAVAANDKKAAPSGYELITGDAREMHLRDLLEDEILLDLPQSPVHEDVKACGDLVGLMHEYRRVESAVEGPAKANPFAVLNKLKSD